MTSVWVVRDESSERNRVDEGGGGEGVRKTRGREREGVECRGVQGYERGWDHERGEERGEDRRRGQMQVQEREQEQEQEQEQE